MRYATERRSTRSISIYLSDAPSPLNTPYFYSLMSSILPLTYTLITLLFLVACDSASDQRELLESAPELPPVTVESEVRGAFLGVWGEPMGRGRVWFVGGEKTEGGETRSLVARYEPHSGPIDHSGVSPQGLIGIEDERQGGILWWVWGSGVDGELWAVGEEGQILRRRSAVDIGSGG